MPTSKNGLSRRALLGTALRGLVAINVASVGVRAAHANEPLSEDDPTGKALGYHIDTGNIDKTEFSTYADGQTCDNCLQYQGKDGAETGGCALFPGKTVTAKGWCKVWVKKA